MVFVLLGGASESHVYGVYTTLQNAENAMKTLYLNGFQGHLKIQESEILDN